MKLSISRRLLSFILHHRYCVVERIIYIFPRRGTDIKKLDNGSIRTTNASKGSWRRVCWYTTIASLRTAYTGRVKDPPMGSVEQ